MAPLDRGLHFQLSIILPSNPVSLVGVWRHLLLRAFLAAASTIARVRTLWRQVARAGEPRPGGGIEAADVDAGVGARGARW